MQWWNVTKYSTVHQLSTFWVNVSSFPIKMIRIPVHFYKSYKRFKRLYYILYRLVPGMRMERTNFVSFILNGKHVVVVTVNQTQGISEANIWLFTPLQFLWQLQVLVPFQVTIMHSLAVQWKDLQIWWFLMSCFLLN